MTLGPALIFLSLLDRELGAWSRPIVVFGRVPLFYYLLHLPLIHGLAVLLGYLKNGSLGANWAGPPFELPGVYAVWLAVVLLLVLPMPLVRRI